MNRSARARDRVPTVEIPLLSMEQLARERMEQLAADMRREEALRTPLEPLTQPRRRRVA